MNRLILIGNGFDIAHGLETKYIQFIDAFWNQNVSKILQNIYNGQENEHFDYIKKNIQDEGGFAKLEKEITNFKEIISFFKEKEIQYTFKNKFLYKISKKRYEKWVDIEIEYYNEIKEIINPYPKTQDQDSSIPYTIEILNKDFSQIKKELFNYLNDVENKFDINKKFELKEKIHLKMYAPIYLRDLRSKVKHEIINKEYEKYLEYLERKKNNDSNILIMPDYYLDKIYSSLKGDGSKINFLKLLLPSGSHLIMNEHELIDLAPDTTLLLNFNYTSLDKNYMKSDNDYNDNPKKTKVQAIHIHGKLNDINNPIIFGYGDELDEDYKKIENMNDNHLLDNVKSIKYLETDNYKKLLEFLESDEYQVFIMGHSCGISDRTLLNTIFEHDNCISIKPFYHKYEIENDKGEKIMVDNFQDIIQNISRNFTDKVKMRDRVVNKKYCEPLS